MFLKFPSIGEFNNAVGYQSYAKENQPEHYSPEVTLRAKIKLHGMNMAFGMDKDGVWVQSRNGKVTAENDSTGLCPMLMSIAEESREKNRTLLEEGHKIVFYGEGAGTGLQKKDAITLIGKKAFFPFLMAIVPPSFSSSEDPREVRKQVRVMTEPDLIATMIAVTHPNMHVMPWATEPVLMNYEDTESLQKEVDVINGLVEKIGEEDPFVKELFGVSGMGEGMVFVPVHKSGIITMETFANLAFKSKSERHRVKISDKAAKIIAEIPEDVKSFVEMFVTDNRMEQILTEQFGGVPDKKQTGAFIIAVTEDVFKESIPEREAMNADEKHIRSLASKRIAGWLLDKVRSDHYFSADLGI